MERDRPSRTGAIDDNIYIYIIYVIQYERDEVDNNNMFYTSVPRNNRESESHLNDSVVLCGDRNLFPSRPPPQPFCPAAMQEVYINKL